MILAAATVIGAALIGQAGGAPEVAAKGNALQVSSALDFLLKGGWPMASIGVCSLVALAIIIERAWALRRSRVVPRGFVTLLNDAAGDRAKALELCHTNHSPIARILSEAIKCQGEPQELLEKHVEEEGGRELVALRQHMRVLSALPQISTMLGLLGTVFGMIKTFQAVAADSEALGKTEMLAKGIFEAWTCTAGGLLVAIPVMIAFHWLMGKIDTITTDVDRTASEFVKRLRSHSASAPGSSIETPRFSPVSQPEVVR